MDKQELCALLKEHLTIQLEIESATAGTELWLTATLVFDHVQVDSYRVSVDLTAAFDDHKYWDHKS